MSDILTHSTLASGLVSYWKMEEASGTRVDSHGSNDLSDNNTVGTAAGIIDNGADFERSNSEYLSITDAAQTGLNPSDFSVSAWVKFETSNVFAGLVSKRGVDEEYSIYFNNTNEIVCRISANAAGSALSVSESNPISNATGVWYHFVITVDSSLGGAGMEFYENASSLGRSRIASSFATSIYNGGSVFRIGAMANPANFLDAVVDEVGFWNRVLTSSEISDLYNSGAGLPYDGGGGPGPTAFTPKVTMIN